MLIYKEKQKQFTKLLTSLAGRYSAREIFEDFVYMFSSALQNAYCFDKKKEEDYINRAKKYNKEDLSKFADMGSLMVQAVEDDFGDFLGEIYMQNVWGDKKGKGQCFTLYHIGKLMSDITYTDESLKELFKDEEITSLADECCGGGALLISAIARLKELNINYQRKLVVYANDLDPLCVRMTFIMLQLLGVPAIVTGGNTLTKEYYESWETIMYWMFRWKFDKVLFKKRTIIKEEKKEEEFKLE